MLRLLPFVIASVWIFHGLYSKLLGGVLRHRAIVARVLGEDWASLATIAVGAAEISIGLWVLSGWRRRECALAQTLAIGAMNTLEIARARDLLISAPGMVALNAAFLAVVWFWTVRTQPRHPSCQHPQAPKSTVSASQMKENNQ